MTSSHVLLAALAAAFTLTSVAAGGPTATKQRYPDVTLPAWSPDGQRIAFLAWRPTGSSVFEMRVVNADGSGQRGRVLARKAGSFAWSPDGRRIAFEGPGAPLDIYVVNADGSGQRRLTRDAAPSTSPVWSPDGRRIAFESNWQVNVMNADGSGQRRLTRNGARNFAPAWSPDGQRIAFERRLGRQKYGRCSNCGRATTFEVHVRNADGSGQQKLTTQGAQPSWSPDGRTIAFMSERDGNAEIYAMNADGSGQRNLTRTRGRHERWLVWSPAQKP
jgi:TolB protein